MKNILHSYYWEYRTPFLSTRVHTSKNFKTKKQASTFRNKMKANGLWYSGTLYYIATKSHHTIVK